MNDTWDDDDRAIARALGADAPEGGAVDADALADYEAALTFVPFEEVEPPRALEDRVVAAALARRPAAVRAIDARPTTGRPAGRRISVRWVGAAAAAVVAASVIVVLLAGRTPSVPGSPAARIAPAAATGDAAQVHAAPGTRRGILRTSAGAPVGEAVLGAEGSGYLTRPKRAPGDATTSWLWLDTGPSPVRVGALPNASTVHFVVRGDVGAVRGVIISTRPDAPEPVSGRAMLSS